MEPYRHTVSVADQVTADVKDLSEAKVASLLAEYDVVRVAMGDGNWTREIHVPVASAANRGRVVAIDHEGELRQRPVRERREGGGHPRVAEELHLRRESARKVGEAASLTGGAASRRSLGCR